MSTNFFDRLLKINHSLITLCTIPTCTHEICSVSLFLFLFTSSAPKIILIILITHLFFPHRNGINGIRLLVRTPRAAQSRHLAGLNIRHRVRRSGRGRTSVAAPAYSQLLSRAESGGGAVVFVYRSSLCVDDGDLAWCPSLARSSLEPPSLLLKT